MANENPVEDGLCEQCRRERRPTNGRALALVRSLLPRSVQDFYGRNSHVIAAVSTWFAAKMGDQAISWIFTQLIEWYKSNSATISTRTSRVAGIVLKPLKSRTHHGPMRAALFRQNAEVDHEAPSNSQRAGCRGDHRHASARAARTRQLGAGAVSASADGESERRLQDHQRP